MRRATFLSLWLVLALLLLAGSAVMTGCSNTDESFNKQGDLTGTCVSCHQDQDLLVATATPDTSSGGGEAGEG